jgi:outer membrane receptor protein involved in Fe transport
MRIAAAGLLALLSIQSFAATAVDTPTAATDDSSLEEVVVTAQRRSERLQDVPISVSVFNQATMDAQGTRDIDDLARLTPGLTFTRGAVNNNSDSSDIAIRGIDSTAGAATTGIYIDDTPWGPERKGWHSGRDPGEAHLAGRCRGPKRQKWMFTSFGRLTGMLPAL